MIFAQISSSVLLSLPLLHSRAEKMREASYWSFSRYVWRNVLPWIYSGSRRFSVAYADNEAFLDISLFLKKYYFWVFIQAVKVSTMS